MERQYLYTERTHLMCPNMNFGIVTELNSAFDEGKIRQTLSHLVHAHPFLSALLGHEKDGNRFFYDITSESQVELIVKDETVTGLYDKSVLGEYERLVSTDWNLIREGMLKVVCWRQENKLCMLFVFHHLLADGRAALSLVSEFADCYVLGIMPQKAEEKLISSKQVFPRDSELPFISKLLVAQANKKWEKENHQVSYKEYHEFAGEYLKNDKVIHDSYVYDAEALSEIQKLCKESGVTVNDYLTAKMMGEEKTDKVIIASDLREQLSCYEKGALGNYSTAFSVRIKAKGADTISIAKEIHKKVQKIRNTSSALYLVLQCYARINLSLLDAAAISALGAFDSKAGRFIGTAFFGFDSPSSYSISNLGKIKSSSIDNAMFIPPASPAVKKIQGILTVNGRMNVCVSQR